jgi:hypothetical protein
MPDGTATVIDAPSQANPEAAKAKPTVEVPLSPAPESAAVATGQALERYVGATPPPTTIDTLNRLATGTNAQPDSPFLPPGTPQAIPNSDGTYDAEVVDESPNPTTLQTERVAPEVVVTIPDATPMAQQQPVTEATVEPPPNPTDTQQEQNPVATTSTSTETPSPEPGEVDAKANPEQTPERPLTDAEKLQLKFMELGAKLGAKGLSQEKINEVFVQVQANPELIDPLMSSLGIVDNATDLPTTRASEAQVDEQITKAEAEVADLTQQSEDPTATEEQRTGAKKTLDIKGKSLGALKILGFILAAIAVGLVQVSLKAGTMTSSQR